MQQGAGCKRVSSKYSRSDCLWSVSSAGTDAAGPSLLGTPGFDSQQLLFLSPCCQNSCIACWHGYRATGRKLFILGDGGWSARAASSGFVTTDYRAVLIFPGDKSPSECFPMMLSDWVAFWSSKYLIFIYSFSFILLLGIPFGPQ